MDAGLLSKTATPVTMVVRRRRFRRTVSFPARGKVPNSGIADDYVRHRAQSTISAFEWRSSQEGWWFRLLAYAPESGDADFARSGEINVCPLSQRYASIVGSSAGSRSRVLRWTGCVSALAHTGHGGMSLMDSP